jgi:ribonuclease HI
MSVRKPHFLLFCDGAPSSPDQVQGASTVHRGRWRFVLEDVTSGTRMEATDAESAVAPDRIALLAVVRGLEALPQPSQVTLVTSSRYVSRGLQFGLMEWRENNYCWEHFGAVQPIRNADLWQRIDQCLQYHSLQCRLMLGENMQPSAAARAPHQVQIHAEPMESIDSSSNLNARRKSEILVDSGGETRRSLDAYRRSVYGACNSDSSCEGFMPNIAGWWMRVLRMISRFFDSYRAHSVPV